MNKTFPLDNAILAPGSAASLDLAGATDADVVAAVSANGPFPTRPGGMIDLAHIGLSASGGKPVAFQRGGITLGFELSASVTAGAGIFDDPKAALTSLNLGETPGLDLTIGSTPGSRYALLRTGYKASGSVKGEHPIGVLGTFTFGASGAGSGLSAVLHRFPSDKGADTVLKECVSSWKLPGHIKSAGSLAFSTWVLAEASGSFALKLGASLGYDFSFVRQAKEFGLSGDIGMKIDAAATASFGFDVSGRYLVVVGREAANESDVKNAQKLRLRMFKLSSKGMEFGLNLKIGVTGVETLTKDVPVDDFVKAVFGVHGAQIVTALAQIEKWTDPTQDVGKLVAGLVNEKALKLLRDFTKVDIGPDGNIDIPKFNDARAKLVNAIKLYQNLPSSASNALSGILGRLDKPEGPAVREALKDALTLLSSDDESTQKEKLLSIFSAGGFAADSPVGLLLDGLAEHGLLNLLDRLPHVRDAARTVLSILDGDVIASIQRYINANLNLEKVLNDIQEADFNKLDSFLVGRLAAFFEKTLKFSELEETRKAINLVISKRKEIYEKAQKALNSRHGFELAATWKRTSADKAVIDVVFDMGNSDAEKLFQKVVEGGDSALNQLFVTPLPSVKLNAAILSHELTRKTTLEISLPFFNFQKEVVTTALGNVKAEDDGGRILLFDATGNNAVRVRNKFASGLTVTIAAVVASLKLEAPNLRIHSTNGTWSYELLYAKAKMKREELEAMTRPFISQFMADQFAGTSLSTWYNELETTSEPILHNGPEAYGDLCASLEVTIPGEALGAWASPISNVPAASKNVSLAIQRTLKSTVLFYYLTKISNLANLASSAPLLAWASIPTAFSFDGSKFNHSKKDRVFWDHADVNLRRSAVNNNDTAGNLRALLPELRLRLEEAGLHGPAQFYQDGQVHSILEAALSENGDRLLAPLLRLESRIVEKAHEALKHVQEFRKDAPSAPTKAVEELTDFSAEIVTAFNQLLGGPVFADLASFRAVGQVVFVDATRALSGGMALQPRTMLTLAILQPSPPRTFQLSEFLAGKLPSSGDIAVAQRLVSA